VAIVGTHSFIFFIYLVFYTLTSTGGMTFNQVGDFGIAGPIPGPGQIGQQPRWFGAYAAPEIWSQAQYNQQPDMFSLGKLIELDMTAPQNTQSWYLMKRLTARNPLERPTGSVVIQMAEIMIMAIHK
jgi:hypothetical protein